MFVNRAAAQALGLKDPNQAIGATNHDLMPDRSFADAAHARCQSVIQTGRPIVEEEIAINWPNRERDWASVSMFPLHGPDARIHAVLIVSLDITWCKSDWNKINLAMRHANDGLWHRDLATGVLWWSARSKEMLGYESEPKTLTELSELVHPEDRSRVNEALRDHLNGTNPRYECIYRLKHADGNYRWIHARGTAERDAADTAVAIAGSQSDVTEHEEFNRFTKLVLDTLPGFIFVKDRAGRFQFANRALLRHFNKSEDQVLGKTDSDINSDEQQVQDFVKYDRSVIDQCKPRLIRKERVPDRWFQTQKVPLVKPGGKTFVLGVSTDITQAVEAEADLERERDLLHTLMNNSPDGIFFKDRNSCFTRVNVALAKLAGVKSPDDMIGRSDHNFFPSDYSDAALAEERELLKGGVPVIGRERWTASPKGNTVHLRIATESSNGRCGWGT